MIYTVTLNPSLDCILDIKNFRQGHVNHAESEQLLPGGKGINVSVTLKNLGIRNVALGFTAGYSGQEIERRLRGIGCETDFIRLGNGSSRVNIKMNVQGETEINAPGPEICEEDLAKLFERIDRLSSGDFLILAGSIPNGVPETIYQDILQRTQPKNILAAVSAEALQMMDCLKFHPFLINPTRSDLESIFRSPIKTGDEIIHYARCLQKKGAMNVLVSLRGEGDVLVSSGGKIYRCFPPSGRVMHTVGSRDSMVAGFLAGYLKTGDYAEAFRLSVATGSATAFSSWLAKREDVERLMEAL